MSNVTGEYLKEAPRLDKNSHGLLNISRRILCSKQRILSSSMHNEHHASNINKKSTHCKHKKTAQNMKRRYKL